MSSLAAARENETFGQQLRRLRMKRGLSMEALARQVGVSWMTVHRWEVDHNLPSPKNEKALAQALLGKAS